MWRKSEAELYQFSAAAVVSYHKRSFLILRPFWRQESKPSVWKGKYFRVLIVRSFSFLASRGHLSSSPHDLVPESLCHTLWPLSLALPLLSYQSLGESGMLYSSNVGLFPPGPLPSWTRDYQRVVLSKARRPTVKMVRLLMHTSQRKVGFTGDSAGMVDTAPSFHSLAISDLWRY